MYPWAKTGPVILCEDMRHPAFVIEDRDGFEKSVEPQFAVRRRVVRFGILPETVKWTRNPPAAGNRPVGHPEPERRPRYGGRSDEFD